MSQKDRRKWWGTPQVEGDIRQVFLDYLSGKAEEVCTLLASTLVLPLLSTTMCMGAQLPWCDQQLAGESGGIIDDLRWLNRHGFLTINR